MPSGEHVRRPAPWWWHWGCPVPTRGWFQPACSDGHCRFSSRPPRRRPEPRRRRVAAIASFAPPDDARGRTRRCLAGPPGGPPGHRLEGPGFAKKSPEPEIDCRPPDGSGGDPRGDSPLGPAASRGRRRRDPCNCPCHCTFQAVPGPSPPHTGPWSVEKGRWAELSGVQLGDLDGGRGHPWGVIGYGLIRRPAPLPWPLAVRECGSWPYEPGPSEPPAPTFTPRGRNCAARPTPGAQPARHHPSLPLERADQQATVSRRTPSWPCVGPGAGPVNRAAAAGSLVYTDWRSLLVAGAADGTACQGRPDGFFRPPTAGPPHPLVQPPRPVPVPSTPANPDGACSPARHAATFPPPARPAASSKVPLLPAREPQASPTPPGAAHRTEGDPHDHR